MAGTAVKLAISLPPEDFQEMEKLRRKFKASRSAVVRQALRTYFQVRRQQALGSMSRGTGGIPNLRVSWLDSSRPN